LEVDERTCTVAGCLKVLSCGLPVCIYISWLKKM